MEVSRLVLCMRAEYNRVRQMSLKDPHIEESEFHYLLEYIINLYKISEEEAADFIYSDETTIKQL